MYKQATGNCVVIVYTATLLKVLSNGGRILVEFLGSSMYTVISSARKDILASLLPICIPLVSFSCLLTLANTSSTELNSYRESGHVCCS